MEDVMDFFALESTLNASLDRSDQRRLLRRKMLAVSVAACFAACSGCRRATRNYVLQVRSIALSLSKSIPLHQ
jgi:hypothetical protein